MSEKLLEKYTITHVDCANCAAKLEDSVGKLDSVGYASLDFATQTFHIETNDIASVVAQIKFIEPEADLIPFTPQRAVDVEAEPIQWISLETLAIATAIVIFISQVALEGRYHQLSLPYIETFLALSAYLLVGWNVILGAVRTIRKGLFFDENVLMVIATAGAFAIHAYGEAIGVMLFFKFGDLLQNRAVNRSRKSIKGLLAARPSIARLRTEEGLLEVSPESIKAGDVIVVRPGDKVPIDGEVIEGSSQVDNSALTGESVPITVNVGDLILAGGIAQSGALTIRTTKIFTESSIAKILELVENATARKARTEKFITSFARYYTPAVVLAALLIAFIPPLFYGQPLETWIYRALVMLVISCPCALVVSIPLGYFAGIGRSSRQGILVKGSNYIDALSNVKSVVFDKTGTLTEGVFKVESIQCFNGWSENRLLEAAAAAEFHSTHPIAHSIRQAFTDQGGSLKESDITEHKIYPGMGVSASYNKDLILVGNDLFVEDRLPAIDETRASSLTKVHVVVNEQYAGFLSIGDQIKHDARHAVTRLRELGVKHISMLTGDATQTAEKVANEIGLDSYQANLLPEDKVERLEELIDQRTDNGKIVFVGDGINDAPVLARADIGVAMGGLGSEAAIETADVVLMTDSPSKLVESISISKQTRRIVWQNIALAFTVKALFLSLGAFGLATMWEAVFADVGTALIAVANSSRILRQR
jgi:Cd2+/Zn2+-exporting ATPase